MKPCRADPRDRSVRSSVTPGSSDKQQRAPMLSRMSLQGGSRMGWENPARGSSRDGQDRVEQEPSSWLSLDSSYSGLTQANCPLPPISQIPSTKPVWQDHVTRIWETEGPGGSPRVQVSQDWNPGHLNPELLPQEPRVEETVQPEQSARGQRTEPGEGSAQAPAPGSPTCWV